MKTEIHLPAEAGAFKKIPNLLVKQQEMANAPVLQMCSEDALVVKSVALKPAAGGSVPNSTIDFLCAFGKSLRDRISKAFRCLKIQASCAIFFFFSGRSLVR